MGLLGNIDLAEIQEMDITFQHTLKFYSLLTFTAFWEKPAMTPLFACRMIKLSLDHGICKYSIFGFVQYAAGICHQSMDIKHVQEACRIGKEAMTLLSRFGSAQDIKPKLCLIY